MLYSNLADAICKYFILWLFALPVTLLTIEEQISQTQSIFCLHETVSVINEI